MKWVCVSTAPNEPIGESWAGLLRDKGIPAYVKSESWTRVYFGSGMLPVRVMVPEDKEEDGRRILDDVLGPNEWPPEEGPNGPGRR